MAEIVESYQIPDDTADQFNNIAQFAKNMILKDEQYCSEGENEFSSFFSKYLLKYFQESLTE